MQVGTGSVTHLEQVEIYARHEHVDAGLLRLVAREAEVPRADGLLLLRQDGVGVDADVLEGGDECVLVGLAVAWGVAHNERVVRARHSLQHGPWTIDHEDALPQRDGGRTTMATELFSASSRTMSARCSGKCRMKLSLGRLPSGLLGRQPSKYRRKAKAMMMLVAATLPPASEPKPIALAARIRTFAMLLTPAKGW